MRQGFYDGIWVSLTKQHILRNPKKHFVIPDVRFPNEAKMLYEIGGEVWRVKRGEDPLWFRIYQDVGVEPKDVHESEWRWAKVDFNHIIYNDLGIEELRSQVKGLLASNEHLVSA